MRISLSVLVLLSIPTVDSITRPSQTAVLVKNSIKIEDESDDTHEENITIAEDGKDVKPSGEEITADVGDADDASEVTGNATEAPPSAGDVQTDEKQDDAYEEVSRRPPNRFYRFLLGQGRVGHFLVMFFVWVAEFVSAFLPQLSNSIAWTLTAIFGAEAAGRMSMRGPQGPDKKVNEQYAAFVNTRSIRGRQKKKASRQADKDAAEQLKQVGNVAMARYRHLSLDFMKKHGVGEFRTETDLLPGTEEAVLEKSPDGDEDEDVGWVVDALTNDEAAESNARSKTGKPTVSVGLSDSGVSVGMEFSIGKTKRKKRSKRRKLIAAAATDESSRSTKTKAGPRASDREGGGGVLGRIRDFSANNLVSRSLLGAYPGDAPPPSEAASRTGVMELASRYGYGDWSDDELIAPPKKKRRKKRSAVTTGGKTRTKSRRKRSSSSSVSLGFEIGSSSERTSPTTKRKPISQSNASEKHSSKMVRLPTERLKEKGFDPSED